jgi:hypothetical protein
MYYLLFILGCLIMAFIIWKIKWILINVWILMACLAVIGLIVLPLSLSIGLSIVGICVTVLVLLFFIALISYLITLIVVSPLVTIWYTIKNIFTK